MDECTNLKIGPEMASVVSLSIIIRNKIDQAVPLSRQLVGNLWVIFFEVSDGVPQSRNCTHKLSKSNGEAYTTKGI